jgi:uncharacterized protein
MSDPRTLVRLLDELLWRLRRAEFDISTGQAIDVARAALAVGLGDPIGLRRAIASIVVARSVDRPRYEAIFADFFSRSGRPSGSLLERLRQSGFQEDELAILRDLVTVLGGEGYSTLGAVLSEGVELDRLLVESGSAGRIDAESELLLGFETHRLLRDAGLDRSGAALRWLRSRLFAVLGVRGEALADAVAAEIERLRDEVRSHVRSLHATRVAALAERSARGGIATKPFAALTQSEAEAVRRALRRLASGLERRARVRARRASRGHVDVRRTVRASLGTGGVPFIIHRKARRRDLPKIVLLCDISESVKTVSALLLEFTYAAQKLFEDVRTFVFVSELGETTGLFARESAKDAVEQAWRGAGVVRTDENSNYGRVLRTFQARHLATVDRRTIVVILGDGRTNYQNAGADVLDRIREKAAALYWFCPEPRGRWSKGDSAMLSYASKCSAAYEVTCAADIERIARAMIVARRPGSGALHAT